MSQIDITITEVEEYGEIRFNISKDVSDFVAPIDHVGQPIDVLDHSYLQDRLWVPNMQLSVYRTFDWLVFELIRFSSLHVNVVGFLGQDVEHDLATTVYDDQKRVVQIVRGLNRQWFTQAVQARAAMLRQKVKYP